VRVMLVSDLRSPHAVGWSSGLIDLGIDAVLVSSRRLSDRHRAALPPAVAARVVHEPTDVWSRLRGFSTDHPGVLTAVRAVARRRPAPRSTDGGERRPEGTGRGELPLELRIADRLGAAVVRLAREHRPDLVHALRVPFEGIAATAAARSYPTAVSIWGQDLARQAPAHPVLAERTRAALRDVRGVHADCARDVELARTWGAPADAIALVAPGNMGFDEDLFHPGPDGAPRDVVVCPRGPASHVNYLGFLAAADEVTRRHPGVTVVATGLAEVPEAVEARARAAHPERIVLTGTLDRAELADVYRRALVVVSPAVSDGTPNSVLEGMACGAVPVVGDIEPLRALLGERLPDALVDPTDASAIATRIDAVLAAPEADRRRWAAAATQVAGEWSRRAAAPRVADWYERLGADRAAA